MNRNAWVLPYIFTAFLSLRILQFHAKPWTPLAAARGLQAWLLIRCFSDDRGSLTFSTRSKDAVHQVEDFVRLDTRRQADRLMTTA